MSFTPILVIAFARPNLLSSLLNSIEKLGARTVLISIDGPTVSTKQHQKEVSDIASEYATRTHHDVRVIYREKNLGIYEHMNVALADFFAEHNIGIILEDDIEFRESFIDYVDSNDRLLAEGHVWSIAGHNPLPNRDLVFSPKNSPLKMTFTNVHTIWGWATSRENVKRFLNFSSERDQENIFFAISLFAQATTRDPILRLGIRAVWARKISRAISMSNAGGWDNWWVVSGWFYGLPSLMPTYSLARENPNQAEGQSHLHANELPSWGDMSEDSEIIQNGDISFKKLMEIQKLRVWGIRRAYCWTHVIRLIKQGNEWGRLREHS